MDERKAFEAWWASRPVTVLNAHEGLALMVWQAATKQERERRSDELSDALQSDLENGVKWLNEVALGKFGKEYPELAAAIRNG